MTDPMTSQPYPLWCAAVDEDETEIHTGRVVGWIRRDPEKEWVDPYVPIVAFVDRHGTPAGIHPPSDGEFLFLADTRRAAVSDAVAWMNREGPFQTSMSSEKWNAQPKAVTVGTVRGSVAERLDLELVGEPEVTFRRETVFLTWPLARHKTKIRLDEEGFLVESRPSPVFVERSDPRGGIHPSRARNR